MNYHRRCSTFSISFTRTKDGSELYLNSFLVPEMEAKEMMTGSNAINIPKAQDWMEKRNIQSVVDRDTISNQSLPHLNEHLLSRRRTPVSRLVSMLCSSYRDDFKIGPDTFLDTPVLQLWRDYARALPLNVREPLMFHVDPKVYW